MTPDIQPFFLPSAAGRIFCVYFPPQGDLDSGRDVLFFPPFAEELNKSRRMIAFQARALARRGVGVLVPDLYGTGDSDGDFLDARWELWQQDMVTACAWLRARGRREIIFWGQRLGALLTIATASEEKPIKIVLWQPVARGTVYLTQFLRLRLVADMMTGGESLTTDDLRRDLQAGLPVEIAGYRLHPELAAAIDALDLVGLAPSLGVAVTWLELVAAPERPLAHVSRQIVERWRSEGHVVETITMSGEPFWSTPEITEVSELIEVTVQQVLA